MNSFKNRPKSQDVIAASIAIVVVFISGLAIYQTSSGESGLAAAVRAITRSVTSKSAATKSAANANGLNLGINLDGPAYWSPLGSHCDATTAFSPWMEPNTTDYGKTGLFVTDPTKLTADNYPLKNADSITLLLGYNSGPFKVSFDGSGDVNIQGVSNWTKVGNKSSGTVNLQTGNLSLIQIRNVDTTNPIRNLKIVPANESECVAGNTYRNLFLTKLAPFKTIRFMDWQSTNESQIVNWSDRSPKTAYGHMGVIPNKMGNAGLAYEDLIELANITGKDIWVNVPAHASDDFMRQFARLLKNNLNADSKVYVEYSNEVWNSIFEQHRFAKDMGHKVSPWPNASDTEVAGYYYGMQTKKMADIFKSEFGATQFQNRIYPVLGSNIVAAYWPFWGFSAVDALYKNEANVTPGSYHNIRAIAVNPYLGSDQLDQVSGNDIFEKLKNVVTQKNAVWLADMKRVNKANGFDLPYVIYESGQHLVGKDYRGVNYHDALNDPKMADVYKTLYTWWNNENPGQPAVHFAFISKQGRDADYHWGLFENMNQTTSVRYQALMDLANGGAVPPKPTPPPPPVPPTICPVGQGDGCTPSSQRCTGNSIEICNIVANNCTKWQTTQNCAANTQCTLVNQIGSCVPKQISCSTNYIPVCGNDGKTYSNECYATNAQATVGYLGLCQSPRVGDLEVLTANYNRSDCSTANNWCSGADIDTNGKVDFNELVKMGQNFNRVDCTEGNNWCERADINRDGKVTQFAPGAAASKGDFDANGAVDSSDLLLMFNAAGRRLGELGYNSIFDLTHDNVIDKGDYIKFNVNYRGENLLDVDKNNVLDLGDINFIMARLNVHRGDGRYVAQADLNRDGIIDNTDAVIISNLIPISFVNSTAPSYSAPAYSTQDPEGSGSE